MAVRQKVLKYVAVIENGYGNVGFTKSYDSKKALYDELADAVGENGSGIEYGDINTDVLDELDITCYAVESSWKVEVVPNGLRIVEK